jgi:aldose 1-epimerase
MTKALPGVSVRPFGTLADGSQVDLYTLTGDAIELHAITYGGIITSLKVPDREGAWGDVVLGHPNLERYIPNSPYLGAIVGRYANRIANGRFVLDGVEYQLARNDGPNHLHGGLKGFDQYNWLASPTTSADGVGVTFTRTSPAGEEQYPGTLTCSVSYLLTSRGTVEFRYDASTDAPTIVNLTQHTYFNLAGDTGPTILDHELTMHASHYTPVDRTLIPTGRIVGVDETAFDFRKAVVLRHALAGTHEQIAIAGGFDHNFVLDRSSSTLVRAATLHHPGSGRMLHVSTTEPGLQFYDGHLLDGSITGANGRIFDRYAALCLETQHYPDSPHHAHFPSVELRPSQRYRSITRWEFTAE